MTVILGLDCGLATFGLTYIQVLPAQQWLRILRTEVYLNPFEKGDTMHARIQTLRSLLEGGFSGKRDYVCLENVMLFGGTIATARASAGFATALCVMRSDEPRYVVSPTEVKRAMAVPTGVDQKTSKALVQARVEGLDWAGETPVQILRRQYVTPSTQEHSYDATAVALTLAKKLGFWETPAQWQAPNNGAAKTTRKPRNRG